MTVTPLAGDNTQEVGVGGVVPGVLSLEVTGSANFGAFVPGVARDYTASLAARATSSATAAELTVRDPSSQSHRPPGQRRARPGLSRSRSAAATRPTRTRRSRRCPRTARALRLLSFPAPFSAQPLTIDFKQHDRREPSR